MTLMEKFDMFDKAKQQSVEDAVAAIANGEMVIVTDDDDRECEGDLVCSAKLCTTEMMGFIIRHTSGIVCAPTSAEIARRLNLTPMVADNDAPLSTAFTVSIDVKHGLTTGISGEQRCNTVRAMANPNSSSVDFVRPGHVFPLIARKGGVLMRSGHTEAAVDLCALANLPEVAVICEMANDDGSVMRGDQIRTFAAQHDFRTVTIADLIAWRQARESLVSRVTSFETDSVIGPLRVIGYETMFDQLRHYAFVKGVPSENTPTTVRLHRSDILGDIIRGGTKIDQALQAMAEVDCGVLVYLRDGAAGVPLREKEAPESSEDVRREQWLEIGLGAQILRDLGINRIRLLSSKERSYVGLRGFDLTIDETVPM